MERRHEIGNQRRIIWRDAHGPDKNINILKGLDGTSRIASMGFS
jgi:hypothetical protein